MTKKVPVEEADSEVDIKRRDVLAVVVDPLAEFSARDEVETPDGVGMVDDVITSGSVNGMDASNDNPVYAVVVEDGRVGVGFYREDELSSGDIPSTDGEPSDFSETDTNADTLQDSTFEWPPSWKESERSARMIALDVWTSMNGQHSCGGGCCVGEMEGTISNADEFCADFKDRLYGTEKWRGGWAD